MAKDASAAFDAAKITEALKDERVQNQAIFDRELQVVEREMRATRDAELRAILDQTDAQGAVEELQGYIDGRRRALGAEAGKAAVALREAETALGIGVRLYEKQASDDAPSFKCGAERPNLNSALTALWNSAQKRCARRDAAKKVFDDVGLNGRGAIVAATLELNRVNKEKETADKAVKDLTATFKKQSEDLKKQNAPPTDLAKRAKKFKEDLEGVKFPDAANVSRFGIDRMRAQAALAWLDETRTHIDKLLDATKSGSNEVPPGVADDLQIATVLSSITADLQQGFRYPRVSALVLESEHIRLERDRQKKIIERLDEETQLVDMKRLLAIREQEILAAASGALKTLDSTDCSAAALKQVTFTKLPDKCKGPIANALLSYFISWTVGRIPQQKIEWAQMNLDYTRSLDDSEAALAQWQNLIQVPLQALLRSYQGGLKPEQLGRLFNDLELGAIAVGVQ
jgi:hypothetical protein